MNGVPSSSDPGNYSIINLYSAKQNTTMRTNGRNNTIKEFHGIVGRSWLNKSVAPSSSTTQLSLSKSMIVVENYHDSGHFALEIPIALRKRRTLVMKEEMICALYKPIGTWAYLYSRKTPKPFGSWNPDSWKIGISRDSNI